MKIDRLVSIVITLIEEDKVTVSSLAKKLNVSIRTINRDILKLSNAGITITTVKGKNGGVMIDKEYKTQNGLGLLECSERVEKLFEDSSLKEFIENNQ